MDEIKLEDLELLSWGGQAKIYKYSNDKVIRVPQRKIDIERQTYEYTVYKMIQDRLVVPKVYDLVYIGGVPCMVMERIQGINLVQLSSTNLFRLLHLPNTLAHKHSEILKTEVSGDLRSNHQKAEYCINNSQILRDELKIKLFGLLENVSDGQNLCHGDFHPENILVDGKKAYTIDWSAASKGTYLYDITNTYLTLLNLPRVSGQSDKDFKLKSGVAYILAKQYLRKIKKLMDVDNRELWKWFLIKAAERTFYGMENEKQKLVRYLERNINIEYLNILKIKRQDFV